MTVKPVKRCPCCLRPYDGPPLGRFIGDRIVHRWSGGYGTVIREHSSPGHAVVEWDGHLGREGPYRLDVCRPMMALVKHGGFDEVPQTDGGAGRRRDGRPRVGDLDRPDAADETVTPGQGDDG